MRYLTNFFAALSEYSDYEDVGRLSKTRSKAYLKTNNRVVQDCHISVLEWPRELPDFNAIENLWKKLKFKVGERRPSNLKELEEVCTEEWGKIPANVCHKLVSSYKRRLEAVTANKGPATKY